MPKITKRIVDAFEPDPAGERFLWDTELRGSGVRMMPSGVTSYIIKYRNAEARQRKMTIGRVGTLTPEEARQLARDKLAEVSKGADPSAANRYAARSRFRSYATSTLKTPRARSKPRRWRWIEAVSNGM